MNAVPSVLVPFGVHNVAPAEEKAGEKAPRDAASEKEPSSD
jgi:hypothetical protein